MFLIDLPEDTLRDLSLYLHWLDVANLWFTGSSQLLRKFASGGVWELDLQFSTNIRSFRWPSIFSSLSRISRIRIQDMYASDTPVISSSNLTHASRSLRELRLTCTGAFHAVHDLLRDDPLAFPMLHTLSIHMNRRDTQVVDDHLLVWPTSLVSLTFQSAKLPRPNLRLSSLPSHLTDLHGEFNAILDANESRFPNSLLALRLNLFCFFDILPLLPLGLQKLLFYLGGVPSIREKSELAAYKRWRSEGLGNLPPTLHTLQLPIKQYDRNVLLQLPKTLTEIQHFEAPLPVEDFALLPPLLKRGSGLLPILVTKSVAPHIPQSIEHVEGAVDVDAIPYLPRNVRTLGSTSGPNSSLVNELNMLHLLKIPSALESLIIYRPEGFPFAALPTTLTNLRISGGSLDSSQIPLLPNTLKILEISDGVLSDSIGDWKLLPKCLEQLSINTVPVLPIESSTFLPRSLTMLKIFNCRYIPSEWFKGLPRELADLQVPLTNPPDPNHWTLQLPRNLTRLQLFWTSPRAETARKLLSSLPHSLTSFRILGLPHSASFLVDSDLALLPRRLKEVELISCEELTVESAQKLPKTCISVLLDSKEFVCRNGKRTLGGL